MCKLKTILSIQEIFHVSYIMTNFHEVLYKLSTSGYSKVKGWPLRIDNLPKMANEIDTSNLPHPWIEQERNLSLWRQE